LLFLAYFTTISQMDDAAKGGQTTNKKRSLPLPTTKSSNWLSRPSDFAVVKRVKASTVAADGNNLIGKMMKHKQLEEDLSKGVGTRSQESDTR
jgi:hypothetical protein